MTYLVNYSGAGASGNAGGPEKGRKQMRFGVGVDYSLKALLMLAERYPSAQPLQVEVIATAQDIPENYLRRLLITLQRRVLVASQKGPSGGYFLAPPPPPASVRDGGERSCSRLTP